MSIFWGDLFGRFNTVRKMLQSIDIDLCVVVELYESLVQYISNLRNEEMFKKCGFLLPQGGQFLNKALGVSRALH